MRPVFIWARHVNDEQLLRYSRHILLNEIGVEGQERLRAAHVLVIGAGGLGSPAALYLASAGVGTLTLVDGDRVDLTNLQRQIIHTTGRIGMPKAESGRIALGAVNPEVEPHSPSSSTSMPTSSWIWSRARPWCSTARTISRRAMPSTVAA